VLRCAGRQLDLDSPRVMGVINVTPDSFSDGGHHAGVDAAYAQAQRMLEAGAAIIDIGGESTRPGAAPVPLDEELRRVLPVVHAVSRLPVVVSVDTSKPEVMQAAIDAGAGMINDVRALAAPGALQVVARADVAVCLMHMQGEPASMQQRPAYDDVVTEVVAFLRQRVEDCRLGGIGADRVLVDPGFGFGKTIAHNLELLRRLAEVVAIGLPVLVGLSRKSMLARLTGRAPGERVAGSVALALLAVQAGARIVRVHDVPETVDALKVWTAVSGG
jgi:dihydropteroate synthase